MKYLLFIFYSLFFCAFAFSQDDINTPVSDSLQNLDSSYKEDQFYAGLSYNLLIKKPANLSQSGFSIGLFLGYIKDMPINKQRNVALGLGLGLASNSFNNNMLIDKSASGNYTYSILSDTNISYTKNKLTTYLVEMPLEFRWRTSTAAEYKFWRIYAGVKLGYVLANTSKFKGDLGFIRHSNIKDIDNFQYGLTLSAGYNTWNLHVYYGLNSVFKGDAMVNNAPLDLSTVKFGLIFYIL